MHKTIIDMRHSFMQEVYVVVNDLSYGGVAISKVVSRSSFYRMQRWDGRRYLIERCSEQRYEQVQREMSRRSYDKGIMQKYNVGPNYSSNRWFMEQVRPTA